LSVTIAFEFYPVFTSDFDSSGAEGRAGGGEHLCSKHSSVILAEKY